VRVKGVRGKHVAHISKVKIKDYLWDEKTGRPENFTLKEIEESWLKYLPTFLTSVRHHAQTKSKKWCGKCRVG